MHNFFYIAVRTIPFWCIPIGLALITTAVTAKRRKLLFIPGILMIAGSIVFLMKNGQFKAVPFVHQMLNSQQPGGFR